MKKLFIVLNSEKFLISHRLQIAKEAQRQNYDVYVVAPDTGYVDEILAENLKYIKINISRSSINPFKELRTVFLLWKLYRSQKPDIIHHVTIKVCLLGSLAAKMAGQKTVINAISGFGYAFSERSSALVKALASTMMRICFKSKSFRFIVQNPDDFSQLSAFEVTENSNITLIKGSGVDLNIFNYEKPTEKIFTFLFPSRMLYEKGVLEFIESAKILKSKLEGQAQFILVGNCEDANKSVIPLSKIKSLLEPPYINYLGVRKDMVDMLKRSNVVVLPSYYREGLPKTLIEACAVGRPIITTELPGCKECLKNNNGIFVEPRSAQDLADKELQLFQNRKLCLEMGLRSRELAEKDFDVNNVVKIHMAIYKGALSVN